MNKKRILIAALVLALTASMIFLVGCGKKKTESKDESANINPLTGLELKEDPMSRPFIVSTDNDSYLSRPQSGLSQADIIYEVPIEGGGSRYEPIYYSEEPDLVGAIRSCRPYIINIAREYDAVLVHNGQSPQAKEIFDTIDRISSAEYYDVFHHEDNPNLPGNLYSEGETIVEKMKELDIDKTDDIRTFEWLDDDEKAEGDDADEIEINYADGAYNTFKYDSETKLYTKYVKDEPLVDANNEEEITCANILVQEVPFKIYDGEKERLNIDLTAGGDATMFTQGKVVKGTWEREDLDSPTIFKDEDGNEFEMTPGTTWVQIIDSTVKFDY